MLFALSCFLVCLVQYGAADVITEFGPCTNRTDMRYYKSGISEKDKALILKLHNDLRQEIALGKKQSKDGTLTAACCMRKMEWDKDLERAALTYVKGCLVKHWIPAGCECGQNFYKTISSSKARVNTPDWQLPVSAWQKKSQEFVTANRKPFVGKVPYEMFTQMVWQNSNKLGCAAAWFYDKERGMYPWTALYACQYYQPGNVEGGVMYYAKGDPECTNNICVCSKCSQKKDEEYPSLCNE